MNKKETFMRSFVRNVSQRVKQQWLSLMDSTRNAMSFGSQCITKLITTAHGDNWRRKNKKK
jgi:hypothetical protein